MFRNQQRNFLSRLDRPAVVLRPAHGSCPWKQRCASGLMDPLPHLLLSARLNGTVAWINFMWTTIDTLGSLVAVFLIKNLGVCERNFLFFF